MGAAPPTTSTGGRRRRWPTHLSQHKPFSSVLFGTAVPILHFVNYEKASTNLVFFFFLRVSLRSALPALALGSVLIPAANKRRTGALARPPT